MKGFSIYSQLIFLFLIACNATVAEKDNNPGTNFTPSEQFAEYWWTGVAEINSYTLEQARYGEIHKGNAVLIFVTEDFSKKKHVKLDNSQQAGNDAVNVLKLNFTKKFTTGIYPYSMMMSSFKPVSVSSYPNTFKVTATSQEWCGHTFTQLDLEKDRYEGHLFSYFESEGSESKISLQNVLLEDEIWNTIRLDFNLLPTGNVNIIPGLLSQRLSHNDLTVLSATASLLDAEGDQKIYTIEYENPKRTLKIFFQSQFPYQIKSWEDTHISGGKTLTTKAKLNKSLKIDYWNKNKPEDKKYRIELGLE